MCVYSMVSQHYQDKWPSPQIHLTPMPTPAEYADFQELLRKAREYDRLTGQPDCPDPKKVEWQKELKQFMKDTYGIEPSSSTSGS